MEHVSNLQKALVERGLDAILLTGGSNVFYTFGYSGGCTALVTPDAAWVYTDSRYIEDAVNKIKCAQVIMTDKDNTVVSRVNEALAQTNVKTLGFEERSMAFATYLNYSKNLKVEQMVPAQDIMDTLRSVKSREELAIMIKAQRIAEAAFNDTIANIRLDMTETEFAAELVYRMVLHGASDKSFGPIAVSGDTSSIPHGKPQNRPLQKGFFTIDFGAKYQGYCSDTTRTFCIGKPDAEMVRIYNTVLEAQKAGIAAAKGGIIGWEVDAAARQVIEDAGYGEFFGHNFGHSLGLDVHEPPNAARTEQRPLPVGAVISAEPGIYIPGKYGVRIEDVLYLTEDGNEDITLLPKELIVL